MSFLYSKHLVRSNDTKSDLTMTIFAVWGTTHVYSFFSLAHTIVMPHVLLAFVINDDILSYFAGFLFNLFFFFALGTF